MSNTPWFANCLIELIQLEVEWAQLNILVGDGLVPLEDTDSRTLALLPWVKTPTAWSVNSLQKITDDKLKPNESWGRAEQLLLDELKEPLIEYASSHTERSMEEKCIWFEVQIHALRVKERELAEDYYCDE